MASTGLTRGAKTNKKLMRQGLLQEEFLSIAKFKLAAKHDSRTQQGGRGCQVVAVMCYVISCERQVCVCASVCEREIGSESAKSNVKCWAHFDITVTVAPLLLLCLL